LLINAPDGSSANTGLSAGSQTLKRASRFQSLFSGMSLSQNRCTLLRDMLLPVQAKHRNRLIHLQ
jgi:hypothetical protein